LPEQGSHFHFDFDLDFDADTEVDNDTEEISQSGELRPENRAVLSPSRWIPAFAGMTRRRPG